MAKKNRSTAASRFSLSSVATLLVVGFAERAVYLVPILTLAVMVGEPLAKLLRFPALRLAIGDIIASLNRKLNRTKRSTATRLYRGMAALVMLLVPTLILAVLLMRPDGWVQLLTVILLVALFGELLRPYQLLRQRRAAKAGKLTLQSAEPHFLFPDTHALLRYTILCAADRVTLLIGASLYFLAFSIAGLLCYLMLAGAARYYAPAHTGNRAFGWAAHALFSLVNILPRAIAAVLNWLAALFTPRTQPFTALRHPRAARYTHGWMAMLLNLSLGGPIPTAAGPATLPWIGRGTPKPEAIHLTRALQLVGLTLLLWVWMLASTIYLLPSVK